MPFLLAAVLLFAQAGEAGATRECAAWTCDAPARHARGAGTFADTGDLCMPHARRTPFVLVGRFFVAMGVLPALLLAYVAGRAIVVYDRYWGLPEARRRLVLVGGPVATAVAWIAYFVIRAA